MSALVLAVRRSGRNLLGRFPFADGLFRRLVWSRIFFPEVEMRFISSLGHDSIDIAIDVGAATGSYAWILNRKARSVFCFEPGEEHGRYLERMAIGSRISVVRAAVGDRFGTVKMYTPGSDTEALHSATLSLANPISRRGAVEREVDQVSLDGYFEGKIADGRSIDLIKVDVEGYELEVLKGAITLISRYHPLIFCEIEKRHNADYHEIFRFLRNAGYTSCVYRDGGFGVFDGEDLEDLQSAEALKVRLDGTYDPLRNSYVNNFVFQHKQTRIKVLG